MINNGQKHPIKKNKTRLVLLGLFALALMAFGAAFVAQPTGVKANVSAVLQATQSTPAAQSPRPNSAGGTTGGRYQTVTVQHAVQSDSIAGTGTVTSAQILNLGFTASGSIASLKVQVGDSVSQGQVLATLDSAPKLQLALKNAQLAEQLAQQAVDDLQSQAQQNLAQSLADQSAAQKAYADAQAKLHTKGDPRCAPDLTMTYYFKWLYSSEAAAYWQGQLDNPNTGYGHDYILQKLQPEARQANIDLANYKYCQGYTDQEIAASQANLQAAQAGKVQAQAKYQLMKANNGIDPSALQIAQANLKNTQLQVSKAQADLAGATLTAPMDGTVTSVNAQVGLPAGKSTIVILADLNHPLILTNIDETDLGSFMVGCPAQVTFNAYPGKPYTGKISQVYPTVATVQGAAVAQGLVTLQNNQTPDGQPFPLGLTASVQVTCSQPNSSIQIPAQALYEPSGQQPFVYVMNTAGLPEKRAVTMGSKTGVNVEILSGLNDGERVITVPVTNP